MCTVGLINVAIISQYSENLRRELLGNELYINLKTNEGIYLLQDLQAIHKPELKEEAGKLISCITALGSGCFTLKKR